MFLSNTLFLLQRINFLWEKFHSFTKNSHSRKKVNSTPSLIELHKNNRCFSIPLRCIRRCRLCYNLTLVQLRSSRSMRLLSVSKGRKLPGNFTPLLKLRSGTNLMESFTASHGLRTFPACTKNTVEHEVFVFVFWVKLCVCEWTFTEAGKCAWVRPSSPGWCDHEGVSLSIWAGCCSCRLCEREPVCQHFL